MGRLYHPDFHTVVAATGTEADPLTLEGIVRKLPDKSLFLSWTGGGDGEPNERNIVMSKRSFDNGATWTEERVLFSHPSKGMFMPGLFQDGNSLYAFPDSYYNDTAFVQDLQSYISVSHDGGATFSIPRSIGGGINNVHIKCTLKVGNRWIFACSWIELEGQDWASFGRAAKPCIVAGKVMEDRHVCFFDTHPGCSHTEYCGVLISDDEGKTFRLCGKIGAPGQSFVEPMLTVLSDGTLVMLLRAFAHVLYESRSYDGGETWTKACPTEIPTPVTKVLLLKDSAGKIYLVLNPNPHRRNPLSLWTSTDDMVTWSFKADLADDDDPEKTLCYPDGYLDEENGTLCLSWDDRRHIYYSTFPL